jgi:hypothetical protein
VTDDLKPVWLVLRRWNYWDYEVCLCGSLLSALGHTINQLVIEGYYEIVPPGISSDMLEKDESALFEAVGICDVLTAEEEENEFSQ